MKRTRLAAAVRVAGFVLLLAAPLWCDGLFFASGNSSTPWDWLGIPALVALGVLLILLWTRREPFLRMVLFVSLLERLACTGGFLYLSARVYHGSDAVLYVRNANILTHDFYATGHLHFLQPLWSNNFIVMVTSDLFLLFWPSLSLAMVVFSLLAFAGQYLTYRAYIAAYPGAERNVSAVVLLMMPSLVFWTGAVGKDALMLFFLGLVLYGFARLERRFEWRSLAALGAGVAGACFVRPHVGAMIVVAFLLPYTLLRPARGLSGMILKMALLPLLLAITVYLTLNAATFIHLGSLEQVQPMLEKLARVNQRGTGSGFGPASLPIRLLSMPLLFFRPLPWEVNSLQSGVAALEALGLLIVFFRLRRRIWQMLAHTHLTLFTWFLVAFVGEFYLVFSAAMSNFGLLARQRAMALPFMLMLLCVAATLPEPVRQRRAAVPPPYPAPAPSEAHIADA